MKDELPKTTTKEIHEVLLTIGIPTHFNGFRFLVSAIELILMDPSEMEKYNGLYADIAHLHKTNIYTVERSIRNAIEFAFRNGNFEFLDELFKYSIKPSKGAPSNRQFISRMYFYMSTK